MSTLPQDITPDHSPDADELGRYIHSQEMIQKKLGAELRSARLAAAARKIRAQAPAIHDVVISINGHADIVLLDAVDASGNQASAEDRLAAEEIISGLPRADYLHPAGSRINITDAAAWWTGR